MRYELIQLAQLVFALTVMFGAFLAGLGLGWRRWGRPARRAQETDRAASRRPTVSSALFTPAHLDPPDVVLDRQLFDITATPQPAGPLRRPAGELNAPAEPFA